MGTLPRLAKLAMLLYIGAHFMAGCAGPDLVSVRFRDGRQLLLKDWTFYYQYAAFTHPTCSPTTERIIPVRAKLSDELHLQSDDLEEIVVPRDDLKSIEYWYTEYALFPLEARVTTASGEVLSFGAETFAPANAYLTTDNCIETKNMLLQGVDTAYPHDQVSLDLGLSLLPDPWADPYRIELIEFQ